MTESELGIKTIIEIGVTDLLKGCDHFTRQTDSGTHRVVDICSSNRRSCPFYEWEDKTYGTTEPEGWLSRFDCGIEKGVEVGLCRLQKDAIKIGPFVLFDKLCFRPTPF